MLNNAMGVTDDRSTKVGHYDFWFTVHKDVCHWMWKFAYSSL